MKSLIKLDEFLPHLPAALADGVQKARWNRRKQESIA